MPDQVGPYRLIRRLGRGGMGEVHLARQESLGRDVALKLLRLDASEHAASVVRFHREAEAASRLQHPGLVRIFDHGHEGEYYFIAMELVQGQTLGDRLQDRGPMDLAGALDLTAQLLDALHACHQAKIEHRDLKPANIMIESDGRVRLLDLGLARLVDRTMLTEDGVLLGTPRYLPPEYLRGEPTDARADMYQAGLVLLECLRGRPVFQGPVDSSLMVRIMKEGVPPLDGLEVVVPDRVARFIEAMVALCPDDRPPSAPRALAWVRRLQVPTETPAVGAPAPSVSTPRVEPMAPVVPVVIAGQGRLKALILGMVPAVFILILATSRSPRTSGTMTSTGPSPTAIVDSAAVTDAEVDQLVDRASDAIDGLVTNRMRKRLRTEFWLNPASPTSRVQLRDAWKQLFTELFRSRRVAERVETMLRQVADPWTSEHVSVKHHEQLLIRVGELLTLRLILARSVGVDLEPGPFWDRLTHPGHKMLRAVPGGEASLVVRGQSSSPVHLNRDIDRIIKTAIQARATSNDSLEMDLGPEPGAHAREAWLFLKIVGGTPVERLYVKVTDPAVLDDRGRVVALVRGSREGAVQQGWIRIDRRVLTPGPMRLRINFHDHWLGELGNGMRVDKVVLAVRP